MDSLIFMPDSVKHAQVEETTKAYGDSLPVPQSGMEEISKKEADIEVEVDVEVENVERPVDLYKVLSCYFLNTAFQSFAMQKHCEISLCLSGIIAYV